MMQEKITISSVRPMITFNMDQLSHIGGNIEKPKIVHKRKHKIKKMKPFQINLNLYVSFARKRGDKWFERNQFLHRWVELRSKIFVVWSIKALSRYAHAFFSLEIYWNQNEITFQILAQKNQRTQKPKRENHALIQSIVAVANIYSFLNINCNNMNGKIFINLDWIKRKKRKTKNTYKYTINTVLHSVSRMKERERMRNPFVQKAHIKPKKEWINSL